MFARLSRYYSIASGIRRQRNWRSRGPLNPRVRGSSPWRRTRTSSHFRVSMFTFGTDIFVARASVRGFRAGIDLGMLVLAVCVHADTGWMVGGAAGAGRAGGWPPGVMAGVRRAWGGGGGGGAPALGGAPRRRARGGGAVGGVPAGAGGRVGGGARAARP